MPEVSTLVPKKGFKTQQLGLPGYSRALVAQAEGTEFKSLAREGTQEGHWVYWLPA